MKRLELATTGPDLPIAGPSAGSWGDTAPRLTERLTTMQYESGELRTPSRLSIEVWEGSWRALLTEPDAQAVLSVAAESPEALLPALEALLASDSPPWRAAPWLPAPKKRRAR